MVNTSYNQNEYLSILKSNRPSLDLYVNKEGQIAKRGLFSSVAYLCGYKAEQSDSKLKKRIEEMINEMMSAKMVEQTEKFDKITRKYGKDALTGLFLEKIGKLKNSQLDRTKFEGFINPRMRNKIIADLKMLSKNIEKEQSCLNIKQETKSLYGKIVGEVILHNDAELQSHLSVFREKSTRLDGFHNFNSMELRNQVQNDLQDVISKIESPKGTLAAYIEAKFHLRERDHLKSGFEDLLEKAKLLDTGVLIDLMVENYDKVEKEATDPDFNTLKRFFNKKKIQLQQDKFFKPPKKEQLLESINKDMEQMAALSKMAKNEFLMHLGVPGPDLKNFF